MWVTQQNGASDKKREYQLPQQLTNKSPSWLCKPSRSWRNIPGCWAKSSPRHLQISPKRGRPVLSSTEFQPTTSDPSPPGLPLVPLAPFSPPSRRPTPLGLHAFPLPRAPCACAPPPIELLYRLSRSSFYCDSFCSSTSFPLTDDLQPPHCIE